MTIKLATNTEIRDNSAYTISYDSSTDNVIDPAMGLISNDRQCSTCNSTFMNICNGHYGAIRLTFPIPNPLINDFFTFFINSYCTGCKKFIFSDIQFKEGKSLSGINRYRYFQKILNKRRDKKNNNKDSEDIDIYCYNCKKSKTGYVVLNYDIPIGKNSKLKTPVIGVRKIELDNGNIVVPNPYNIQEWILDTFTNDDIKNFGLDYPLDSLYLGYIPMVPNNMRYQVNELMGGQNPLTTIYNSLKNKCQEIYGNNPSFRDVEEFTFSKNYVSTTFATKYENNIYEWLYSLVIYAIIIFRKDTYNPVTRELLYKLINMKAPPVPTSLFAQSLGKQGYFRRVINGCRVDMSGRSVLTGAPYIPISNLIIPILFAKKISFGVIVNDLNINFLRVLVSRGPNDYPGCNRIIDTNGKPYEVNDINKDNLAKSLSIGSIVYRHLLTDDIVMCNRYPSMREESFGAHRIIIDPKKNVFAIPMGDTKKMNADFDGDEIQLQGMYNYECAAETLALSSPSAQLISYKDGKSIIGGAKDLSAGIYNLQNKKFDKREIIQLLKNHREDKLGSLLYNNLKNKFGDKEEYTGLELVSIMLKQSINYRNEKNNIIIENGVFKKIHTEIADYYSEFTPFLAHHIDNFSAINFIDQTMNLVFGVNEFSGYTIFTDWILPKDKREKIKSIVNKCIEDCDEIMDKMYQGYININNKNEIDILQNNIISESVIEIDSIIKDFYKDSDFKKTGNLEKSEAETRLAVGFLAQQSDSQKGKIAASIGSSTRTLPIYPKGYLKSESYGLVSSNYVNGLSPSAMFFEALSGRRQLYEKTHSIGETGYFERQVAKNLINIKSSHNGVVLGDNDYIISLSYGFDSFDGTYQKIAFCWPLNGTDEDIRYLYSNETKEYIEKLISLKKEYLDLYVKSYKNSSFSDNLTIYNIYKPIEEINYDMLSKNVIKLTLPFDVKNIILNIPETSKKIVYMSPKEQEDAIEELNYRFIECRITEKTSIEHIKDIINQTYQVRLYCYFYLTSSNIKLSKDRWEKISSTLINKYLEAIVPCGENVGLKAGYTITEPISQVKLNAIHVIYEFIAILKTLIESEPMERVKTLMLGATDIPIIKIVLNNKYNRDDYVNFILKYNKIMLKDLEPKITSVISNEYRNKLIEFSGKENSNICMIMDIERTNIENKFINYENIISSLKDSFSDIIVDIIIDIRNDVFRFLIFINNEYNSQLEGLENEFKNIYINTNGLFYNPELKLCTEYILDEGQLKYSSYYQIRANIDFDKTPKPMNNAFFNILTLNEVDQNYTTTNSPIYIQSVYGIIAAKKKLYEEISSILIKGEFNKLTGSVETRNIKLIVDALTINGKMEYFTRHSMNSSPSKDLFNVITFENGERVINKIVAQNSPINLDNIFSSVLYNTRSNSGTTVSNVYIKDLF